VLLVGAATFRMKPSPDAQPTSKKRSPALVEPRGRSLLMEQVRPAALTTPASRAFGSPFSGSRQADGLSERLTQS